jgi:hypothetical protein
MHILGDNETTFDRVAGVGLFVQLHARLDAYYHGKMPRYCFTAMQRQQRVGPLKVVCRTVHVAVKISFGCHDLWPVAMTCAWCSTAPYQL